MASVQQIISQISNQDPYKKDLSKNETFSRTGLKDFQPETPPEIQEIGPKIPRSPARSRHNLNNSYT